MRTPNSNLRDDGSSNVAVSTYDRVKSLVDASTIVIGALVVVLFLAWMNDHSVQQFRRIPPPPGRGMQEQIVDQEEYLIDEPDSSETALADATTIETQLTNVVHAVEVLGTRLAEYERGLRGHGDSRQPGPGWNKLPIPSIAEPNRWWIEYTADSRASYLNMLDHFKIALGAVSRTSNRIDYFEQLTNDQPATRTGVRKDENRLYFLSRRGRMGTWDKAVIRQAGVDVTDKLVVHFIDETLREQLRTLELSEVLKRDRQLTDVARTVFSVEPAATGFEIKVRDVVFRQEVQQDHRL